MRITEEGIVLACTVSCILLHTIDGFTVHHDAAVRKLSQQQQSSSPPISTPSLNVASVPDDLWEKADRGLRIPPFFGRTATSSPFVTQEEVRQQPKEKGNHFLNFFRRGRKNGDDSSSSSSSSSSAEVKKCPLPAFVLDMIPYDENDYPQDEQLPTRPLHAYASAVVPEESAATEVEAAASKCPVPAFLHNLIPQKGIPHPSLSVSSRQQEDSPVEAVGSQQLPSEAPRIQPPAAAAAAAATISLPFLGKVPQQQQDETATTARTTKFSPLEEMAVAKLDEWYQESQTLHCPFWRRRSGDALDALETFIKHTIVRPENWPLMGPPQAWRDPNAARMKAINRRRIGRSLASNNSNDKHRGLSSQEQQQQQAEQQSGTRQRVSILEINKQRGLSIAEIQEILRTDWRASTSNKGYYVTGRMTTSIYRNDCYFDGPDPDMPIRGLRKFMGVASNLFDASKSKATLLSLDRVKDDDKNPLVDGMGEQLIAHWEMQGVLKLPWRPEMPPIVGTTTYYLDTDGLIERHEETWDVSPVHAFCHTLFPRLAKSVWGGGDRKGLIPAYQEMKTMTDEFIPMYHEVTCGVFEL